MKIRTKIYILFTIFLISLGITVFLLNKQVKDVTENNEKVTTNVIIQDKLFDINSLINSEGTLYDEHQLDHSQDSVQDLITFIDYHINERGTNIDLGVYRQVGNLKHSHTEYELEKFNTMLDNLNIISEALATNNNADGTNISSSLTSTHDVAKDLIAREYADLNSSIKNAKTILFILLGNMFVVVTIGASIIIFSASFPLSKLVKAAAGLNEDDLTFHVDKKIMQSRDEIGELARALKNTVTKLKRSYREMEARVKERTEDLNQAKILDEAILQNVGEGLVFLNVDSEVEIINETAKELLEIKDTVTGKKWSGLIELDSPAINTLTYEETGADKVSSILQTYSDERVYTTKNGTKIPVMVTTSPVKSGDVIVGTIKIFRDIRKEKEIDKAKSEFVSLASHQLRTPLSIIRWYVQSIIEGKGGTKKPDGKTMEYMRVIRESNKRMISLVNSLLNVSRIEMGTFQIEPKDVNIIELAKSIEKELKPKIKDGGIKFSSNYDESIPITKLDPDLTAIILENLLSNSIKYTPEGGSVLLTIGKDDKHIRITVKDTGYGIPESQQGLIFSKLFRADNVKKTDTTGTGLGLYIVKSIVKNIGGSIKFVSEENKGTTFTVKIPIEGMKGVEGTKQLEI